MESGEEASMSAALAIPRLVITLILLASCAKLTSPATRDMKQASGVLLHEAFVEPLQVQAQWLLVSPKGIDSALSIEDGAMRVTTSGESVSLRRRLDISELRGNRIRVSARVRTDSPAAIAALSLFQSGSTPNYSDVVTARSTGEHSWRIIQVVADVDPASMGAEVTIAVQQRGSAWFDDITVEGLGRSPPPTIARLSAAQIGNLITLARAATLIRYRDPSDQAAELDWNTFLPEATRRVLQASGSWSLTSVLRDVFRPIAPAVEFDMQPVNRALLPPRGAGSHLARWRHRGFASGSDDPYSGWREGRDVDLGELELTLPITNPDVARCKRVRVLGVGRNFAAGSASLFVNFLRAGSAETRAEAPLNADLHEVGAEAPVPDDTYSVKLGVRISGPANVELRSMSLACDNAVPVHVDLRRATWSKDNGWPDLYEIQTRSCDSRDCLLVSRLPLDQSFMPSRDILDAELGNGIWLHMPLAVWSDGRRTYPVSEDIHHDARFSSNDLEGRLATVISAWGIAYLFYPYFSDQKIDWAMELPRALSDAATASSAKQLHAAVAKLIAKLHDNHATIVHPALPIDGILPVALRRFGNEIIVMGGVDAYLKILPIGTQVISIDGVPATRSYDDMRTRVSAATSSWAEIFIPYWLTLGPQGTLSTLRVRSEGGREKDVLLPHLPRNTYGGLIHEPRPTSGTQLATGVYYVDLHGLTAEHWKSVLPLLQQARAIILDERGVPAGMAPTVLGHFIDHAVVSPTWQIPLLESGGYQTSHWAVRPTLPRLHAQLIVLTDGRVTSYGETILQNIRDNHLATLVGESSGGTNGNIAEAFLPGGFIMHFTAMRVQLLDGTAIQGKGITPDHLVHPTIQGVRAGKDEVLMAAIVLAEKS
jgi:Peptidase family S41